MKYVGLYLLWLFASLSFLGLCTLMGWATGLDDASGAMMGLVTGAVILAGAVVAVLIIAAIAVTAVALEEEQ